MTSVNLVFAPHGLSQYPDRDTLAKGHNSPARIRVAYTTCMWKYRGQQRPNFAIEPGTGQESVWDYPRPPVIEPCNKTVVISTGSTQIARSVRALRILETASPPTVYLPPEDVVISTLSPFDGSSFCEWKGQANYYQLSSGGQAVAWQYRSPSPAFAAIKDFLCFYPERVDCFLDEEPVRAQAGEFYGGWVTNDIIGPFKGDPGTGNW